ncbi:MAG: DUF6340 family protein [Bacteroidales bacterium]|nr:DUF6340 family protein [Bacteroidales bacterium]
MIKVFKYLFVVWMSLFTSACVVIREIPIETLQPAKITFKDSRKKIAIYAPPSLLDEAIQSNEATYGVHTDSLINNTLYSLKSLLEKAPGFERTSFAVFVTDDHRKIPQSSDFDYFISLDHLQLKNRHYIEQYSFQTWEASVEVFYIALWSVRNRDGDIIENYIDRDIRTWFSGIISDWTAAASPSYRVDAVKTKLPSINDIWWDLGIILARSCTKFLAPHWQKEERAIYMLNKFPELSGLAYTALKNNGHERAINIWEEMLVACRKRGQKKIKGKINYNIAVGHEYMNQLDESIQWLQRSINYSSNKVNTTYLRLLENRKKQSIILDQQTNSNY